MKPGWKGLAGEKRTENLVDLSRKKPLIVCEFDVAATEGNDRPIREWDNRRCLRTAMVMARCTTRSKTNLDR